MPVPSDVLVLIKPSQSNDGANEFLAFLKLEQKSSEHASAKAEMDKQKLGEGLSWDSYTKQSTSSFAFQRSPLEKRKREDVPRRTDSETIKNVVELASDTTPSTDSSANAAQERDTRPKSGEVQPEKWDFKWDFSAASRAAKKREKDTKQAKTTKPRFSAFSDLGFKNVDLFNQETSGLIGKTAAVGAKDDIVSAKDISLDKTMPVQDQQKRDGPPDAAEKSFGDKVADGESTSEQATDPSSSSDDSPLTPDEELVIIDEEGDIRVTVGTIGKEVTALCSSPCLRRASPKWKALIEASPTEIHLDADTEMVLDLLRIAHAQFSGLHTHTFFDELLEFARICHVYEVTELVRPWLHAWVDPWARKALDPGYEGFIFIAWIFGYQDSFEALTHHLAATATSTKVGIPDDVLEMFDQKMRTTIVDNIHRIRNEVLTDIIHICHNQVECLSNMETRAICGAEKEWPTEANIHSELCDCIALGSLDRGLRDIGIFPTYLDPAKSKMTIQGLQTQLDAVKILSYPGHEEYSMVCCANQDFHNMLHLTRREVSALGETHLKHFATFGNAVPRNDPLVWKSKAVEDMGFLDRDIRSNDSDSDADETFPDPHPNPEEYDEDDDGDYEDESESEDSEPDEEYLLSGEESDYTSDVDEDGAKEQCPEFWEHPV